MIDLYDLFFAFQLGGLVYVVTCVLTLQGYLLEWYLDLLLALETKGAVGKWLAKPLGLCERCTAGQVGLWIWLEMNNSEYLDSWPTALLRSAIFVSFTIISVTLIKTTFEKWK